jgi:hypothetical protein
VLGVILLLRYRLGLRDQVLGSGSAEGWYKPALRSAGYWVELGWCWRKIYSYLDIIA